MTHVYGIFRNMLPDGALKYCTFHTKGNKDDILSFLNIVMSQAYINIFYVISEVTKEPIKYIKCELRTNHPIKF